MKIKTLKQVAKTIELDSLFVAGGTISAKEVERVLSIDTIRYDKGKYAKANIGREIHATPKPVWYVTRNDHIVIMTYHVACSAECRAQSDEDLAKIERINAIWEHVAK